MTQAYTNPLFAVLSIIPNFFKIDVVLFFKIIALITLALFFIWITHKAKNSLIMILAFFALPATFIHAFSGLETFLFVALLAVLFIFLYEEKFYPSIFITLFLFFTRPEAWLLIALIPIYFLTADLEQNIQGKSFKSILSSYKFWHQEYWGQLKWKKFITAFLLLFIPLALYFAFHKLHFGSALPNTFYVKSGKSLSIFSLISLIWMSFLASPIIILIPLKKARLFIFLSLMLGAMIASYSTSELQMNYVERFAFHIFAPVYFFVVYIASQQAQNFLYASLSSDSFEFKKHLKFSLVINILLLLFLFLFTIKVASLPSLAHISNYYPRLIYSHGLLGKTLQAVTEKYGLKSFSFGDAGMAAYHSKLIALDNAGLGSSAVATNGITLDILDAYNPNITIFHPNQLVIKLNRHGQKIIYEWSLVNGMHIICDIYWKPDYTISIFAKETYPEIVDLCNKSEQQNNQKDKLYLLKNLINPPWTYWKE